MISSLETLGISARLLAGFGVALALALDNTTVLAAMYQCTDARGKTTFSDRPCPKTAKAGAARCHH
ncbi:MAG: DUF4124 domain-containing protein [Chromatiales bacterium]|jgi:hypothetical protein|nr:DUF4124 domain-containing protein [Chromatiales bacterium]